MGLKGKIIIIIGMVLVVVSVMPNAYASQAAVVPAYASVSLFKASMQAYQAFLGNQNRAAARKLLNSDKVFLSPRDLKVEVVAYDKNLAKVKMSRLDKNAKPVTFYFWTLTDQLKLLSNP